MRIKLSSGFLVIVSLMVVVITAKAEILLSDNFNDGTLSSNWSVTGNAVQETNGVLKILTELTDGGGIVTSSPFKLPAGILTLKRKTKLHYANSYAMPWISLAYSDETSPEHHVFSIYYGNLAYNDSGHLSVYGTFLALGDANPHWGAARNMTVEGPPVIWDNWFDEQITYNRATGEVRYLRNGSEEIIGIAPIIPAGTPVWLTASAWGWYTGHSHYMDDLEVSSDAVITTTSPPPVVFFPGMEGSRLYTNKIEKDYDWTLWPSSDKEVFCELKPGTGFDSAVYTKSQLNGGLLEEFGLQIENLSSPGINIYKTFIHKLVGLVNSGVIKEWEAFPYDWRRDVQKIASYELGDHTTGIIYGKDGVIEDHVDLVERIIQLKQRHGPVTIIGHSNGGLLAKAVINEFASRFGEENVKNYVGRIILVAVPQLGTPDGLLATLHGDFFAPPLVEKHFRREVVETMPGALGLIPSEEFFNRTVANIIEFDASTINPNNTSDGFLDKFVKAFGKNINPFRDAGTSKYYDFLLGTGVLNRQEPHGGDCMKTPASSEPNAFKDFSFQIAKVTRRNFDQWVPPEGVKIEQIIGTGLNTAQGVRYSNKRECSKIILDLCSENLTHNPIYSLKGDGTVLAISAGALNKQTYWVDLKEGRNHGQIMEDIAVQSTIESILKGEKVVESRVSELPPPLAERPIIRMTMKSPVDLQIYDGNGDHTGIIRQNGQLPLMISNIPGSMIQSINGHQVITLQGERSYNIVLDGVESGTFTLEIETFKGDDLVKADLFSALPAAPQTKGAMTISPGMVLSQLSLDYNGDGKIDSTIDPVVPNTKEYSSSLIALGDYIRTLGLDHGTEQALLSSVNAALNAANPNAAKNKLVALSNKLSALSGKKIKAM